MMNSSMMTHRSSRLLFAAYPHLTDGSILAKDIVHFLGCDLIREVSTADDKQGKRGTQTSLKRAVMKQEIKEILCELSQNE